MCRISISPSALTGTLYTRVQIQGVGVRELLRDVLLHDLSAAAVGQGLVPRSEQGGRDHEGEPRQEEQTSSPLPSQTSERCAQVVFFTFSKRVRLQSIQVQLEWRISSKSGSYLFVIIIILPPHSWPSGRTVGVNVTAEGKLQRGSELYRRFDVNRDHRESFFLPANGDVTLAKSITEWALFGERMSSFPLCSRVLEDVLIAGAERASAI